MNLSVYLHFFYICFIPLFNLFTKPFFLIMLATFQGSSQEEQSLYNNLGMWCISAFLSPEEPIERTALMESPVVMSGAVAAGDGATDGNSANVWRAQSFICSSYEPTTTTTTSSQPSPPLAPQNSMTKARQQQRWIWVV